MIHLPFITGFISSEEAFWRSTGVGLGLQLSELGR
jgi:hypothetical protein